MFIGRLTTSCNNTYEQCFATTAPEDYRGTFVPVPVSQTDDVSLGLQCMFVVPFSRRSSQMVPGSRRINRATAASTTEPGSQARGLHRARRRKLLICVYYFKIDLFRRLLVPCLTVRSNGRVKNSRVERLHTYVYTYQRLPRLRAGNEIIKRVLPTSPPVDDGRIVIHVFGISGDDSRSLDGGGLFLTPIFPPPSLLLE